MIHSRHLLAGAALLSLGAAACSDDRQPSAPTAAPALAAARAPELTNDYILLLPQGAAAPSTLARDVQAAGGTLQKVLPEVGLAIVTSPDADFATKVAKVRGVQSVARDMMLQWTDPDPKVLDAEEVGLPEPVENAGYGLNETFSASQWAPQAVHAPEAWEAGYRGAGARIAILDGGIRSNHIDIAPNLDAARSASFVPGQPYNFDTGTFWHGTHVAGIAAAPANNLGITGIAPSATIIGVKVLHGGSGSFTWVINGIIYAATPIAQGGAGAHIINMSLGAVFYNQGKEAAELMSAMSRATMYARQQGVLVVVAAGNDAIDLDHTANLVSTPAQNAGVTSVSALGPLGWAVFPSADLDRPASYTNFGQSAISFGAPGGDFAYPGNQLCAKPRLPTGTVVIPCWAADMVISANGTSTGAYTWAAGTSMAAPALAGVAALIVGKNGPMHPAQLEARLRATSDDLGKPGNDDFYGQGRVNAYRAVTE